ncbi:hypothetical protein [Nocardia sp. NPDC057668]|uniref:hypothetical protein n=1 Tax=Nocardia sp. NPDC057668 TaxID=3346202 RepID=UPI003671D119
MSALEQFSPDRPGPDRPKRKTWVWTAGAATATAIVWAVAIFILGRGEGAAITTNPVDDPHPTADLRGYHAVDDICAVADTSAITKAGFVVSDNAGNNPDSRTTRHPAVDTMRCRISFAWPAQTSGAGKHNQFDAVARLNKQSDPAAEFEAAYQARIQGHFGVGLPEETTLRLTGIGDDAYRVVLSDPQQSKVNRVELAIRDGWMVYTLTWSQGIDVGADGAPLLTTDEAVALLRDSASTTLPKLRA